jgi:hypothetical protein
MSERIKSTTYVPMTVLLSSPEAYVYDVVCPALSGAQRKYQNSGSLLVMSGKTKTTALSSMDFFSPPPKSAMPRMDVDCSLSEFV